jgi:3-methylcrotonyl-CoA carboxylase alpha subunit
MIEKLLIANRGEIVCRIDRTCRRLGIRTATVHSTADCEALHVRTVGESIEIGAAPSAQSYLNIESILAAARLVGADAIHPGIGFLSEDPAFAEAVAAEGLLFIGPSPDLLRRFGDKWAAKREARLAGVPVIGGSEGSSDDSAVVERLIKNELQLPVVLKAAAGGGGRGVRIVRELAGLADNIQSAMREARASFGRADLIVEEFIDAARHIEVQIAGDGRGEAIHLFERECSLQRRFQKVIEEAPAVGLDEVLRQKITGDAVRLARSVGYLNLGTVEFLVAGGKHYFLECNPRLQVEHTVTEEITNLDLVEMQLTIAEQRRLPISQDQVKAEGHAIQLRIYAEDASTGFAPSTGRLATVRFPDDVRIETAVRPGSEITPYYDAMIAKLIVHENAREKAIERCTEALGRTVITGVETNIPFLQRLLAHPVVKAGKADNRFIDREINALAERAAPEHEEVALAAAVFRALQPRQDDLGLWSGSGMLADWHYFAGAASVGPPALSLRASNDRLWPVIFWSGREGGLSLIVDGQAVTVSLSSHENGRFQATIGKRVITAIADVQGDAISIHGPFGNHVFHVVPFLKLDQASLSQDGKVVAPMMGTVMKLNALVGALVAKGDTLVVEESMKMEMSLAAPIDGIVTAIHCREGDVVERNQCLVEIVAVNGEEP